MANINTSIQTSIRQSFKLNQTTKVWLDIISISALGLKERVRDTLDNNPFLASSLNNTSYSRKFSSDNGNILEETLSNNSESLFEHLQTQINITFSSKKDITIAEGIISFIDKDGLMPTPLSEIATTLNVNEKKIEDVLSVIKTFDPLGVCASSLSECLYIQLKSQKPSRIGDLAMKVVYCLDLLSKRQYGVIAKELDVQVDKVKEALSLIKTLEPFPARDYDITPVKYIIPELFIEKQNGEWTVKTNKNFIEPLQISKKYIRLIGEANDEETIKYLKDKLLEAKSLLHAIEERKKTLEKVGLALLEYQYDFFENGREHLRPLALKDIANNENVLLSESTISRISNNKYLKTVWGTFAIKYFFSSKVNDKLGSRAVKEIIKRIINDADSKISDEKIRLILKSTGIYISRRTVAKYRNSMNIFSSRYR